MAAGSFRVYQSFQEQGHMSQVASATLALALIKSSYTPATTHSAWSQVSADEASYSATHILSSVDWTISGSAVYLTVGDTNFTAGTGEVTAQYAVLYAQGTGQLVAIAELSSGGDVVASQINLTLGKVLKVRDTSGMY